MEGSDVSGSTDHSSDAPGQVSAISSTDGVAFKPPGATGSAALPHGAPARTSMGRGKSGNQRKQALMMDSHSAGGPGRMGGGSNNGGAGASAVPTPSMDPDKPVKKRESGAENALVVREKTTVVNVHLAEMTRVTKFARCVVVSV